MNDWIDIKERLPEEDEIVLVWLGDGWNVAVYRKILNWKMKKELKFCSVHKRILSFEGVTHWMPAPKRPIK